MQSCQYSLQNNPLKNSLGKKKSIQRALVCYDTEIRPKEIVLTLIRIQTVATLRHFGSQNKLDDDSKTDEGRDCQNAAENVKYLSFC